MTANYFYVEGTSQSSTESNDVSIATPSSLPGPSSGSYRPLTPFQRPIFSSRKGSHCADSFTLKIIQARVVHGQNNKISFVNEGQMFTTIAENTANVPYLSSLIHENGVKGMYW